MCVKLIRIQFNLCIINYQMNYLFILCSFYTYFHINIYTYIQALRRQYITYVVPSIYVAPKTISIQYLDLSRNELDCGDSVLIADILLYQENLKYLDLSFNRLGSRGLVRMCQVLKLHKFIQVFKINHNRIGPCAGKALYVWLKNSLCLKTLEMNHNRLGELIRYPNVFTR